MSVSKKIREGILVLPQLPTPKKFAAFASLALFSGLAFCVTSSDVESLLEQGKNQQALSASDSLVSDNAGDANAQFLRGVALARLNKTDAAIDIFGKLARSNPEVPEYANNLAVLYAEKGEYEKARRWLEAAMSTHPAYATAHRNLGDVYTALAAVAYSKALDQQGQAADLGVQLELVAKLYDAPSAPTAIAQASQQQPVPRQIDAPKAIPEPVRAPPKPEPKLDPKPQPQPEPQPVAPAPQPAPVQPEPAPATPANVPVDSEVSQAGILQTVRQWASAWASQDVDAYLDSYANNFYPGDDQTLAQWRATRRNRVSAPRNIEVDVIEPKVQLDADGRARVSFRQDYTADSYSDRVSKTLILERKASGWRIVREISSPL